MKEYIILAGPNGVGKSTIKNISGDFCGLTYINLDVIVHSLSASDEMHRYTQAAKIAADQIDACFRRNVSFVQESTLAGKSILTNVRRAKDAGYRVVIHFIGVDSADICKQRIRRRVAAGGHGIPDSDVERRYGRSFEAARILIPQVDEVYLYDNGIHFRKVSKYVAGQCIWRCKDLPDWYRKLENG